MKKIFSILILSLIITACANVEPAQFLGPNGRAAFSMRCSGFGRTMQACYQKAGEMCPAGYTIIENSSNNVFWSNNGNLNSALKRDLAIECK